MAEPRPLQPETVSKHIYPGNALNFVNTWLSQRWMWGDRDGSGEIRAGIHTISVLAKPPWLWECGDAYAGDVRDRHGPASGVVEGVIPALIGRPGDAAQHRLASGSLGCRTGSYVADHERRWSST